jgi:hypothetical protein
MNDIRRQLDALLGADRNGDLDIKDFTDDRVCKLYLAGAAAGFISTQFSCLECLSHLIVICIVGLCPHDLFPNTVR